MKKLLIAASLIAAAPFSMAAPASSNNGYLGVGLQLGNYTEELDYGEAEVDVKNVTLKAGVYVNPYLGFEAAFATGITDGSTDIVFIDGSYYYDMEVSLKLKNSVSIFVKPTIPFNDKFSMYGLIGVTQATMEVSASVGGYTASDDEQESGVSFGIGTQINLNQGFAVSAEFISMLDQDDFTYNVANIGFMKTF